MRYRGKFPQIGAKALLNITTNQSSPNAGNLLEFYVPVHCRVQLFATMCKYHSDEIQFCFMPIESRYIYFDTPKCASSKEGYLDPIPLCTIYVLECP